MHDAKMWEHLDHVTYPASKEDLVKACENMSDVSVDDKKWFEDSLPEGSYSSAEEVRKVLESKSESGGMSHSIPGM